MLTKQQKRNHVIAWSVVIIYLYATSAVPGTILATIFGSAVLIGNYILTFYLISLLVFPIFWEKSKILLCFGIIVVLFLYWVNYRFLCVKIIPLLGGEVYFQTAPLFEFLQGSFYYFVITASAAIASFFSRYGLYKLKQQAEKEKLLITKEINFIRNQFNSHLTFDFLNYCNQSIKSKSPETAGSVTLFSDMLRYTLKTQPNEKVPLQNEITYIENFISIQQLLSSYVYVNFTYKGNVDGVQIIPRILITFVENAFKHGIYNNDQYPLEIYLEIEHNQLHFSVKNKINPNKKVKSSHTGLVNAQQTLELYYADKFELTTSEKEGFYFAELAIPV